MILETVVVLCQKKFIHGEFSQLMNFKVYMNDLFQRQVDLISKSTIRNQILKLRNRFL